MGAYTRFIQLETRVWMVNLKKYILILFLSEMNKCKRNASKESEKAWQTSQGVC
jgi:hypothetical protein